MSKQSGKLLRKGKVVKTEKGGQARASLKAMQEGKELEVAHTK